MPHVRAEAVTVKSRLQWEAAGSAVRIELLTALHACGPCSVRELAELMDRPADGLYHHLRKLLRAELIVETEQRAAGTQREAVYDVVADRFLFDFDERTGRNLNRLAQVVATVIRCAARAAEEALATRQAALTEPGKDSTARWDVGWLTAEDVEEVKRHQQAVLDILTRSLTRRAGKRYAVLTYLMPLARGRSAAGTDV